MHFDREQFRITRGALILLFLHVGMSLIWIFVDVSVRADLYEWLMPTATSVWREGKVWTLVTGPFIDPEFVGLMMSAVLLWIFVPQLERWVGTPRFLRFALYTGLAGTVAGTLMGLALGTQVAIVGFAPLIWGATIAYGVIFARQHIQFFGVIPMTGRQLMYGVTAFAALFVLLQRAWELGAAYAAAMGLAVLLTNQKWNPRLAWLRYKKRRERAHLAVVDGGKSKARKNSQWLN